MRSLLCVFCVLLLQACVSHPVGPIALELQEASLATLYRLEQEKRSTSYELSPEEMERLARVAGLAQEYVPDAAKGCLPQYGAEVAFGPDLSVLFCMQCRILQVKRGTDEVFIRDFEPWRDEVIEVLGRHIADIRSVP